MNEPAVRSRLENRRAELLDRLKRITTDVRHVTALTPDFEEQAVERENDDVLANLDVSTRSEMLQIERALARLDAERYGICEGCRRPIPPKRLEALPYATRCFNCQSGAAAHRNNRTRE